MRTALMQHPWRTTIALEIVAVGLVLGGALVLDALYPDLPGYSVRHVSQSLVIVLVCAVLVVLFVWALHWWRLAGYTRPHEWRDLRLYWLPILLLAAPFAGGIDPVPAGALGMLLLGYAATAVWEETVWRGLIVGLLRPTGLWKAVLISSMFFGLAHLGNSALRGISPIIAAQAFGAAVQGIGLAAIRLRTNTIWPLIVIHLLHDTFLQMSTLPIPAIEVPIDTIFAIYGVVILRRTIRERGLTELPDVDPAQRKTGTTSMRRR